MTAPEREILAAIAQRAQHALAACKRRRKYAPPGPFTIIEETALAALCEIVTLCRKQSS